VTHTHLLTHLTRDSLSALMIAKIPLDGYIRRLGCTIAEEFTKRL